MWHGEFRHPRLVALYDAECPWSQDDDFFLGVVEETPRVRVVDLGCGTGRLALALAALGHRVTGVDPARASLNAARRKPGSERVAWMAGTSESLPETAYDVALMTSHVAQFLVDEEEWRRTLTDLYRCLSPGGRLLFDTRDPRARRWEQWNPRDSRRAVALPDGTSVDVRTEVTAVRGDLIEISQHYVFPGGVFPGGVFPGGVFPGDVFPGDVFPGGEELLSSATMRFRSEEAIRTGVSDAGFDIDNVYGGWQRQPVGAGDGELLVLARRPLE